MCCYDKDFRPQAIEMVFSESLFPSDLSVVERVKHWIMMYSELEKFEIKAFEVVLAQKQRLQQEMQSYLLLRQKIEG
jgi:sister-chromatid-cohesion protein PDS5